MNDLEKKEGSGAGSVAGFQIPLGIKQRKSKVDEMLEKCEDVDEGSVLSFFSSLDDPRTVVGICKKLDDGDLDGVADEVRNYVVREVVRNKIKEVVRKKPGGGGYVLYAPNKGKKKRAKAVGAFPTKLGAKRAELARFPPKDPSRLVKLRKEIERITKDPKKQAEKERAAARESFLRPLIGALIRESLFHEEKTGSDWDEQLARLPKQAIDSDQKLKNFQRNIEKKTEDVLQDALRTISRAVDKKEVKIKSYGVKHSSEKGKTYLMFGATIDHVAVEPIYIYVEAGVPKIEMSGPAKAALTKADAGKSKLFRAELVTVQERVLDEVEDLTKAISSRDKYLERVEDEVDEFVAGLSSLQVSVLKNLLVKKYRKKN